MVSNTKDICLQQNFFLKKVFFNPSKMYLMAVKQKKVLFILVNYILGLHIHG